jgi:hypothetical protein
MLNTTALQPIEHQNQRILTTAQIARAYEADPQVITNNFNRNKKRYTEGKHYFCLEGENLTNFLMTNQFDLSTELVNNKRANRLYLWTEKGAWLLAKSLNTDRAWQACEMLVDTYYRQQEEITALQEQLTQTHLQVLPTPSPRAEWEARLRQVGALEEEDHFTDPAGKIPQVLIKACTDQPWDYRLALRTGQVIHFSGARLVPGGEWVTLLGDHGKKYVTMSDVPFARGLTIHISEIAWVADAPNGS